jgi:glycosyltransferase involved in cell wall biosynthesis
LEDIADEIVVVDSFSHDQTKGICQSKGVVFWQNAFQGHVEQKNFALEKATYDHILSLDADEALSERLRQSILSVKHHWDGDGYCFNRLTSYCGRWIKHCGWYPDVKLRLWDRRKGQWGGTNPHDRVIMKEKSLIKHLDGDLLHYSYHSIDEQIKQINSFSDLAAKAAYANGKRAIFLRDILLNPFGTFLKMYFLKQGFLDGYYGFVISLNSSFGKFLKYIKLRELYTQKK